jgi:dihydroflavonol-4-reductase
MILITGATGLVGSHMALQLLKRGKKIRALKRKNSSFESIQKVFNYYEKNQAFDLFEKIEWVKADLLDLSSLEEAFEGIFEIYHLAAQVNFNPKNPNALYKTNVEGTCHMVNLALKYKVKKFCYLSSVAVFPKT